MANRAGTVAGGEARTRVGRPRRVAVLLEPGRSGGAALDRAVAISAEHEAQLTVVAVAPQAAPSRCGGQSAAGYNDAVRAAVRQSLVVVEHRLTGATPPASFALLVQRRDPPLHEWIAAHGFDLVLLPARLSVLRSPRHPETRRLRKHVRAEIRVVAA